MSEARHRFGTALVYQSAITCSPSPNLSNCGRAALPRRLFHNFRYCEAVAATIFVGVSISLPCFSFTVPVTVAFSPSVVQMLE